MNNKLNEQVRLLVDKHYGLELFMHNGTVVVDPSVDETGIDAVNPVVYYGREKIEEALKLLYRQEPAFGSNLELIAYALKDYHENGLAIIKPIVGSSLEAKEIVEYVRDVLNGLKCSFEVYYNDDLNVVMVKDCM